MSELHLNPKEIEFKELLGEGDIATITGSDNGEEPNSFAPYLICYPNPEEDLKRTTQDDINQALEWKERNPTLSLFYILYLVLTNNGQLPDKGPGKYSLMPKPPKGRYILY